MEPEHCGSFVLMSNVYGAGGKYEEVSEVRHIMRQQNVRKTPGCSWIKLSDGVRVFVTGDRTHPGDCFIYAELNSLTASLLDHGYLPLDPEIERTLRNLKKDFEGLQKEKMADDPPAAEAVRCLKDHYEPSA
ncbi:pentatricopeptide repeat-containing protein At3g14730-like [Cornus florida]|uniref:pentatricopeptide repeat-containing protein At3g14730-like n=1 Tax=Cornus florida TaxID=4283 RepID=UPI00289B6135|nr:pentatricopeptide repeat-containing protein At3g14730-like [Cornus florida]